jgi:hypothetical protein
MLNYITVRFFSDNQITIDKYKYIIEFDKNQIDKTRILKNHLK